MNNTGVIACGIALQDGLNPCIFMTCAVFITYGVWLNANTLRLYWLRIIFVLAYALSFLYFDFGPGQILTLRKEFFFSAKIFYFFLGAGAFILGVLFLKDWFLMRASAKDTEDKTLKPLADKGFGLFPITVFLAVVLGALATLAPVNKYLMVLCNATLIKGLWQSAIPLLVSYVIFSMWPLWLVWLLFSIKNLRPSLLKIVSAAIFFTASSCMVFIFK